MEKLTEREQDIYVQGLLETWSFIMYGLTDPKKTSAEVSAFTACVENQKPSDFRTYLINNPYAFGKMEKAPIDHLFENASLLCEKHAKKGDGSRRPVRLIGKDNWEQFSERRALSIMFFSSNSDSGKNALPLNGNRRGEDNK